MFQKRRLFRTEKQRSWCILFYILFNPESTAFIPNSDPNTKIFALSLMFTQEWLLHRELIEKIKKARPELIIIVGGEHPTAIPEYVLRDCPSIDYVSRGEV